MSFLLFEEGLVIDVCFRSASLPVGDGVVKGIGFCDDPIAWGDCEDKEPLIPLTAAFALLFWVPAPFALDADDEGQGSLLPPDDDIVVASLAFFFLFFFFLIISFSVGVREWMGGLSGELEYEQPSVRSLQFAGDG